jgi:hypothetical protein
MKNFGSPKGPIFNKTNVVRDGNLLNCIDESLNSNV